MYGRTDGRSRDYYVTTKIFWLDRLPTVVVGHGSQSMMGLSIDSSSVAMNLRTVRNSKSQNKFNYKSWK